MSQLLDVLTVLTEKKAFQVSQCKQSQKGKSLTWKVCGTYVSVDQGYLLFISGVRCSDNKDVFVWFGGD